jgi:hypothetical protein
MYNKLRVTKNGISEVKYCFSENDDQNNNSVASSVNSESPPIRKIFVGNLSDRVSNTVTLFTPLRYFVNVIYETIIWTPEKESGYTFS